MTERRVDKRLLAPVLMGFFIMGFCDIVAPVTNIISGEFAESQQSAVSFCRRWFSFGSCFFPHLSRR